MAPQTEKSVLADSEAETTPAPQKKRNQNVIENDDSGTFGFMDAIIELKKFFVEHPSLIELGKQLRNAQPHEKVDVFYLISQISDNGCELSRTPKISPNSKNQALHQTINTQIVYKGRAEVDMPLRRFRRQYEQLSQFERGKIIGMMEAGWSARRVARQLGRSDCVVRRCWDQWIQKMSFTRRPGSGRPRQTSHQEDRHIEPFFKKNAGPCTARVSQDCLRTVSTFPWPARSPDLSPIEHIWIIWDGELGTPRV
ncbi:HTH_Tnp_Tc3_2 domain-containing protein [Trichonephila clavipes]|nr:HTH_Tnp_Tc3_2 domain-containing protein [Trichonephila clavipes]